MKNNNRSAVIGLACLLPAALLITSGVFDFRVPGTLVHPVAVMGGLLAAVVANLSSILRVRTERGQDGGIAAFTIRIGNKAAPMTVILVCAVLLTVISGYLLVENFRPRETPNWGDFIRQSRDG